MAAAVPIIRQYLRTIIGLGADPLGLERADAIIDEGIASMEDLAEFDKDDIVTLCTSVRKPGGLITDPNNILRQITNPGTSIPSICESRLILAAYGARMYTMIGRAVTSDSLSRARLREFKLYRDMVDNHTSPDSLPEVNKSFGIMKFLDQFPAYLRECKGVSGVPLSYIIREHSVPPMAIGNLEPDRPWSVGYSNLSDEMIDRAEHEGPAFQDDNANVYRLLQEALKATSHYSSISRHQRRRNGRQAFLDLQLHNMGNSKWDKVVEAAEGMVSNKVWNGRNIRYPLRFHVVKHREAHNDFQRASQHIPYVPPDEATRVRRLLNSIQCNDPAVVSAKTTILADAAKRNDFELASDFLLLAAPTQKASGGQGQRVAAVKRGSGKYDVGATGVENRYYKRHEYVKLKDDQKKELKEMRSGHKKSKTSSKKRIAALELKLEENNKMWEQRIAALTSATSGSNDNQNGNPPLPYLT